MARKKATEDVTHTVEQEAPVTEDVVSETERTSPPIEPNDQQVVQEPQPTSTEEVQAVANAPVDQAELQARRAHEEANQGYRPDVRPVENAPLQANAAEEQLFHRLNTIDARLRQVESRLAADTPAEPTPPRGLATEGDTETDTIRK